MRIHARGIDPYTGDPDPHGMPQIACPARGEEVNPQFTCRNCPCAGGLEEHQAIDDLGAPFYMVNAVECSFDGAPAPLPALWQRFPNPYGRPEAEPPPPAMPGVACPLLTWPDRLAPMFCERKGIRWVPAGYCGTCQFYRYTEGVQTLGAEGESTGISVVCTAPSYSPPPTASEEGAAQDERE